MPGYPDHPTFHTDTTGPYPITLLLAEMEVGYYLPPRRPLVAEESVVILPPKNVVHPDQNSPSHSSQVHPGKVAKPKGEAGRPHSGGFSLVTTIPWKEEEILSLQVCAKGYV